MKKRITAIIIALGILLVYAWLADGSFAHAVLVRTAAKIKLKLTPETKADILLAVKFDPQDHALSCEVAALKMALSYRGIKVSEAELIGKIGFDNTPRTRLNGEIVWGDPQKAFVGSIDGKMMQDGYGVYAKPVAHVANEYTHAEAFENWGVDNLADALTHDRPVVIWGYLGSGKPTHWKTPGGAEVDAVYYEHTFVVVGLKGSADNPDGFVLLDPVYGRVYLSKQKLLEKWGPLGRSGVVIY